MSLYIIYIIDNDKESLPFVSCYQFHLKYNKMYELLGMISKQNSSIGLKNLSLSVGF